MPSNKHARAKLKDLTEKLHGAEEAANADGAGALAKADLKLLEQEVVAEKLKAKRPEPSTKVPTSVDGKLDKNTLSGTWDHGSRNGDFKITKK